MSDKYSVFIVDDDNSARKGLARLVRAGGYEVTTYASASGFLAKLSPEIAGCVILDSRMPDMSGDILAEKLANYRDRLSIIFVTADDDPAILAKAKKLGAAGFFRKPVDGTALIDAISWAFRSARDHSI
ncbi:MAG: response regulator [Desulfobulbia bacterium]